ncbi:vWA domain-containing protein [Pseudocitrobacter cyperus]|uniref:Putative metallopeptidase domain-containing protein n=1 Tax=Pseudocitrobacter cyperus TaxID=3112843 RepID=A0ABV0HKQ3_9ENTR
MKKTNRRNPALEACLAGVEIVKSHTLFSAIWPRISCSIDRDLRYVSSQGWVVVSSQGHLWLNAKRHATPQQWARMIAQTLAALGFGLITQRMPERTWALSVLLAMTRFCEELKIGPLPEELQSFPLPEELTSDAEVLFRQICADGCHPLLEQWFSRFCGGEDRFFYWSETRYFYQGDVDWKALLAEGLLSSVSQALEQVGGYRTAPGVSKKLTLAQRIRQQIMTSYPLLGALAAGFDIEEDIQICQQYDIAIAAINVATRTIWINPLSHLTHNEMLFVFAHELLHAGLNHASRRRGRDPELWNVACDFAINGWLIEMQIGAAPTIGLLHDTKFSGFSAEEIYDDLAQNMRQARKLMTLRGRAGGDLIGDDDGNIFVDAESYCRRALYQGLERCLYSPGRGVIPAGLIEDIRSLSQPPVPWDVALAEWFDERFPPLEPRRGWARPSRRQSTTPEIPRPSLHKPSEEERRTRVFGVILDTSGSMDPQLLGKALGAIASYSLSRDVFAVRFICCDAKAYDRGWIRPEELLHHFTLQGRGGTILQPGVDLLNQFARKGDFPSGGPILIITDGYCEEKVTVSMEHAWLLPKGHRLPFVPRSDVFFLS